MKKILAVLTLSLLAPIAHAGSAGAGPGGNGSVMIGTLGSSITFDFAFDGVVLEANERGVSGSASGTLRPGTAGQLLLAPEQLGGVFDAVRNSEGAILSDDGEVASNAVLLADGRAGLILVNRGTGKITLISR